MTISPEQLAPLYDRVVVKRLPDERSSGLVIPDGAKEKPQRAEVIAVGGGRPFWSNTQDNLVLCALTLRKGDMVLISRYAGADVKIDDEDYTIMREEEVLAIVMRAAPTGTTEYAAMGIVEAAYAVLAASPIPLSSRSVAGVLLRGGFQTRAKNFTATVGAMLKRPAAASLGIRREDNNARGRWYVSKETI